MNIEEAEAITKAIRSLFKIKKDQINHGWCYWWAYLAWHHHGGKLVSTYYHAAVLIKGRYYDSDTPSRVKDINELPIMSKWGLKDLAQQSPDDFISYWTTNGKSGFDRAKLDELLHMEIRE